MLNLPGASYSHAINGTVKSVITKCQVLVVVVESGARMILRIASLGSRPSPERWPVGTVPTASNDFSFCSSFVSSSVFSTSVGPSHISTSSFASLIRYLHSAALALSAHRSLERRSGLNALEI